MINEIKSAGKVIDTIKDHLGRIIYEAFRALTVSGIPPLTLTKSKGEDLIDYMIYGNSRQNGTPTPDSPAEIKSVGKKTENLFNNKVILTNATGNVKEITPTKTGVKFTATTTAGQINAVMGLAKNFVGKTLVFSSPSYYNTTATSFSIREAGGTYVAGGTDWKKYNDDLYYSTITIPEDVEYTTEELCLRLYFTGMKAEDVIEYENIMVTYGDTPKPYVPYGYMLAIKSIGKNLFDKDNLQQGYMSATGFVSSTWYNCTHYILIKPSTDYYFSGVPTSSDMGAVRWFDENKNYISSSIFETDEGTARSPSNAHYCIVNVVAHKKNTTQVELGTIKTSYVPYSEIITEIYIDEPLRSLNEYKDRIDFKRQKIYREIGFKAINGTEKFSMFTSGGVNYFRASIDALKYYPYISGGTNLGDNGICTHYPVKPAGSRGNYTLSAGASNLQTFDFGNNDFADATSFIRDVGLKYKNDTPIEVMVALYNATEEDIELPAIATQKGNTIILADTNIQPSDMEVTYLGKE